MAQIELVDLRKSFGTQEVIHGVNLAVADGSFAVVVGPSGCGKSTLLRMVAGLEEVSGGSIRIAGRDVTGVEPKDRNLAMVFQNYALYPHLSVARNIAFGLELRGTPRAEIERRVARAVEILHLDGLMDRKPRQLSGGQRQRVAMGRAIVREPDVFLFDEPLSNLDAKLRVTMRLEIRRLHEELGATSLYVTHDQVEAMTMGDVLVVMNDGHVEQIGPPLEVYERPATTFVASFIGSPPMNFLNADIRERRASFGAGSLTLTDDVLTVFVGRTPVLFARPADAETMFPTIAAEIAGPLPRGFALTLEVADIDAAARHLTGAGVGFGQDGAGRLVVPPEAATGVLLELRQRTGG